MKTTNRRPSKNLSNTSKEVVKPTREALENAKEVLKESYNTESVNIFPKVLHPDHHRQLETISRDVENAQLRMAVEEQALVNMNLQLEIIKNNIKSQQANLNQKASAYELAKVRFSQFKKDIWPVYGLKENEGLGYDPLTGNIK